MSDVLDDFREDDDPGDVDEAPDLVGGDDDALADGAFDATWTTVRAGSGGSGSELVLDRGGDEVVLAFARPLAAFPALATGTAVRAATGTEVTADDRTPATKRAVSAAAWK